MTKSYSRNILNQYTAAEGYTVSNGSEHEIAAYQGISYTYINDERLSWVTDGTNNYYLYYDALGRCVKRWYDGSTGYYIYDGEKPILEYSVSGQIYGRNVYGKGIDEILMRTDYNLIPANPYYYQQDHEGSVTHLTDGSGTVIEKYRYDAFGAPVYYDGSGAQVGGSNYDNRFLFTGREFLGAWYECRARIYHPTLGRFTSEDPKLFDAGDYNLYRYCHNDPEDMTDPMGLWPVPPAGDAPPPPPPDRGQGLPPRSVFGSSPMEGDASRANNYAASQRALQMAQTSQTATSNRPDPSRYAPGQPYSAQRTAENSPAYVNANGNIVVISQIYIYVFDNSGSPVREGTAVTEKVPVKIENERGLVRSGGEKAGFTDYTRSNGQLKNPDTWKHVFNRGDGFVTRTQTLSAGGRTLNWTATQSVTRGVEIDTHQTGYFW